jgi:hypothetical protein
MYIHGDERMTLNGKRRIYGRVRRVSRVSAAVI